MFFLIMNMDCGCYVIRLFFIKALNGVKDILNPECMRTSQSVDLTFHWEVSTNLQAVVKFHVVYLHVFRT